MNHPFATIVAFIGVILLLKALSTGKGVFGPPRPMAKRFLTDREAAMMVALETALPRCRIHAQVAMGALLKAPPRLIGKSHPADRNAFSQKVVDFVAQDRATGAIVALIEVDDWSHNAQRDSKRDAMTAHAGYRTIRIGRSVQPRIHEVRAAISPLFHSSAAQGGNRS